MSEPRISFVKFDWPSTEDGKIPTAEFLDACGTIIQVLGALGKMFIPVKRDIHGNIVKLQLTFNRNPHAYSTLNDMILGKVSHADSSTAVEALLWLKRGLHFIYLLLNNIVEGYEANLADTSLVNASLSAYEKTLKIVHPWALQKVIITCMKSPIWPRRNDILNSIAHGADETQVVPELKHFVKGYPIYVSKASLVHQNGDQYEDLLKLMQSQVKTDEPMHRVLLFNSSPRECQAKFQQQSFMIWSESIDSVGTGLEHSARLCCHNSSVHNVELAAMKCNVSLRFDKAEGERFKTPQGSVRLIRGSRGHYITHYTIRPLLLLPQTTYV